MSDLFEKFGLSDKDLERVAGGIKVGTYVLPDAVALDCFNNHKEELVNTCCNGLTMMDVLFNRVSDACVEAASLVCGFELVKA